MDYQVYDSPAYRRSRKAYCMECAFEYLVTLFVTDAFLAKLLTSMGMSDTLIGVISSLGSLAFLFQLFSIFVVQRITNTKRFVILFHSSSQLLFMSLYLIPFFGFASEYKSVLVFGCILIAYFGNYFVTSMIYRWGNSYVAPTKRATYSSVKEIISLLLGTVVTLILGYVMDAFEASDNLEGGFIFAAVGILIFCICDFVCLMLIKNDIKSQAETRAKKDVVPIKEVMKHTLGNRNFRNVILLAILWNVASGMTVGFLGSYRINELAFSLGILQVINMVSYVFRAGFSRPFGRFSDRYSYGAGIKVSAVIAVAAFLSLVFTTPSTRWLIAVYTILFAISAAGNNQNLLNITYSYVDEKYFVQASAIKNSIGGLSAFAASLVGSRILAYVQGHGNTLFGIPVYGQQVLGLISCLFSLAVVLFVQFVIDKQERMIQ